ncbi:MAG: flagellar motor switch protein FliG [Tepidisphaeraceae bacterium]
MAEKKDLNGVRKAAILLLTLSQDEAAAVMQRLTREQIEEVSREIASLGEIQGGNRDTVFKEFYGLAMASNYVSEGGLEYAKALLQKSMPEADAAKMIKQVTQQVATTPFSFLQKAESENLLTFIQDEHPQTIALILAHLNPTKASEILVGLPSAKQIEVVKRIANMEQTNPEVIKEVERGLEHRLSDIVSQTFEKAGGVESVAEMLNLADRSTEKGIMEGLEAEDPELVESIRRLMFVFEDVLMVNDKGIQSVLKEVENNVLVARPQDGQRRAQDEDPQEHVRTCVADDPGRNVVHGPGARERRGRRPAEDRRHRPPPRRQRRNRHRRPRRGGDDCLRRVGRWQWAVGRKDERRDWFSRSSFLPTAHCHLPPDSPCPSSNPPTSRPVRRPFR